MKLSLNLAVAPSPREQYGLRWSVPVSAVGLAVLIALSLGTLRHYREYRKVYAAAVALQAREAQLQASANALQKELDGPEFRQVFSNTRFINTLIQKKAYSLTGLTEKVSRLLPRDVRLRALSVKRAGSESVAQFSVEGSSEAALETFLSNLEGSPDFEDVAITNQGFQGEGTTEGAVPLACRARYVGGRKL